MAEPQWIEHIIRLALLQSQEFSALAGGRVFPVRFATGAEMPCVTYQRKESAAQGTLEGYGSESVVVTVTAFSTQYDEAKQLAGIVRAVMVGAPVKATLGTDKDIFHEEANAYGVSMEFTCNQTGGYCNG